MSIEYNKELITLAKNLRKKQTPEEHLLWKNFLSKYRIRFQRQKVIGNFIADFYCHEAKLIVEIDGAQHYSAGGLQRDSERAEILNTYGLQIIRFTNRQVRESFEGVCRLIDAKVVAILTGTK